MNVAPVSSVLAGPGALVGGMGHGSAVPARPSPADVQKAVRQFEAILVRQLLSPSIKPLMSGSSLGGGAAGSGGGVYGYMLTDTLAGSIAAGGGLGLAPVLARQFSGPEADANLDTP